MGVEKIGMQRAWQEAVLQGSEIGCVQMAVA